MTDISWRCRSQIAERGYRVRYQVPRGTHGGDRYYLVECLTTGACKVTRHHPDGELVEVIAGATGSERDALRAIGGGS